MRRSLKSFILINIRFFSVNQPKGKVSVYWDIENVAIPRGQTAFNAVMNLRQRLIESRGLMENSFTAYCDTNILARQHQIDLTHANVRIRHSAGLKTGITDRQIYMDLQVFKEQHQTPATIVLISGDIDFIQYINQLRFGHGHYIIVIHNQQARLELRQTANEAYLWDELLKKSEGNIVETNNPREELGVSETVPLGKECNFGQNKNTFNGTGAPKAVSRISERILPNPMNPRKGSEELDAPGGILPGTNATTVAGGNGQGNAVNQLNNPEGLFVDDDQTIIIADTGNARVIQWKMGDRSGEVVAGGRGEGNQLDQLDHPTDVLIDQRTNSLIICDYGNQRVVRWSRLRDTTEGEILIDNIKCSGLALDHEGYLYISDTAKHEVRRYQIGDMNAPVVVAGGHGRGGGLNQLHWPTYLFVDGRQSVYISDSSNNRVMKWDKDASEGKVVAGSQGKGYNLNQLTCPQGLFVDAKDNIYIADRGIKRVMRWSKGAKEGTVIMGIFRDRNEANQFCQPRGLFLDRYGNLYVVDSEKHRVQGLSIK